MIIRNSTSKCEACYSTELSLPDPIKVARRDVRVASMLALCAIVLFLLTGCGGFPPRVETVYVGGVQVVEHIDTDDAPKSCGDRTEWSGCHVKVGGVSHVWRSSMVAKHTVIHERAHVAGMKHTAWTRDFTGRPCATVTVAGGHYKVRQRICIEPRQEIIITEAS